MSSRPDSTRLALLLPRSHRFVRRAALLCGLVLLALAALAPSAAHAQFSYDANFQNLSFEDPIFKVNVADQGTSEGSVMLYENVITVGGQQIDAIVRTVTLSDVSFNTNQDDASIGSYAVDSESEIGGVTGNEPRFFSPRLSTPRGGGYAVFRFEFIQGGSYNNGTNTGTAVTLQNVRVNSFDVDGNNRPDAVQFQEFGGFDTSELGQNTTIAPEYNGGTGLTRFESTTDQNSNDLTSDNTRVRVTFDELSTFTISMGSENNGDAFFALDFGVGPQWTQPPRLTSPPKLDLNATAAGIHRAASYGPGDAAVAFTASGTNVTGKQVTVDNVVESVGTTADLLRVSISSSQLLDGASERLLVNGATSGGTIPLNFADGAAIPNVVLNGVTYTVTATVADGASVLTFTNTGGALSTFEALADALRYENTAAPLSSGTRTFSSIVRDGPYESPAARLTTTVSAAPTARFTLNAPADIAAGERAAYTVSRESAGGGAVTAGAQVVQLSADGGTFYDAAANGNAVTSVTIADGASSANFWYTHTTAGSFTVTASDASPADGATGIDDDTDGIAVTAAAASKLTYNQQPTGTTVGTAIAPAITVRIEDAYGNLTNSTADVALAFANNPGGANLGGTTTRAAVGGVATFGDLTVSAAGTGYTLSATSGGLTSATSNGFDITAVGPDAGQSTVIANPTSITTDGSSVVTVQLKDAAGNDIAVAGDDVFLATDLGTLAQPGGQANAAGVYTTTLSSTTTGTATVTAYLGTDATGTQIGTATVTVGAGAANAGQSTVTANPATITTDGSSTITVQLKDAAGNNIDAAGANVFLTTSLGTFAQAGGQVDANGVYTTTLSANATGIALVTAYLGSDATGGQIGNAPVTINAGAPNAGNSTVSANPTSVTTGQNSTITVQLVDAAGNNVSVAGANVFLTTDLGALVQAGGQADANGVYTTTLSSNTNGTATVTAYLGTDATGAQIGTATVTVGAGTPDAGQSTVAANPTSITTDGSSTITIQLKDAAGNDIDVAGANVFLATDLGALVQPGGQADANGVYTTTLSSTTTGTATVTAYLGTDATGAQIGTATVTITPGAPNAGQSTVTANPATITTDGNSTITVQLKDAAGNDIAVAGANVFLATDLGALVQAGGQVNANGVYTTTLSSTTTGTATVTAYLGTDATGAQIGTATVTIGAGTPDAGQSTVAANPTSITTDNSSTITVQLKDAAGNDVDVAGANVFLATDLGALVQAGGQADANGVYTTTLSSTTTGTATVTAYLGTDATGAQIGTATVTITPGAPNAGQSTVAANPTSVTTGQNSTITVQLKDAAGNDIAVAGANVFLSTDLGALVQPGGQVDANGVYTTTLSSNTTGTATVTAYLGTDATGAQIGTATVTVGAGPPDAGPSTVVANPTAITTDGSSTITIQLKDAAGNDVDVAGANVFLATDLGALVQPGGQVDANGVYTTTLSSTTTGTATVTAYLGTDATGAQIGTATVTITPGAPNAGQSTVAANPTSITTDGNSTITVQLKDAAGNDIDVAGANVFLATDLGALVQPGGQVNANGVYTTTLSSTTTGTATVTAYLGTDATGAQIGTATVTVTPGAPNAGNSTLVANPAAITTDGSSTITVQLKDAGGNNLVVGGETVTITTDRGSLAGVGAAGGTVTAVDNGDGTYTATLTSTTTGTANVAGYLGGNPAADPQIGTAAVTITPGAPNAGTSTLAVNPATITTDGSSTVTVQLKDAAGNNLVTGGATVTLTTTRGTLADGAGTTGTSIMARDNNDGTYTATLTSRTTGAAVVDAHLGGNPAVDPQIGTTTVTILPGPADLVNSTVSADPATTTTDGSSTITVQLRDDDGNNLTTGGSVVALTTDRGSLAGVGAAGGTVTAVDNGDGTYTATLTSTTPGTATITATLDGNALTDDATVTFEPGAASLTNSTVTADPTTIAADGTSTSTITVQLVDANGNPLTTSGGAVTVATTSGTISNVVDNGDGTYTATLTSTTTGTATITAVLDGNGLTDDATVTFEPGAASLMNSTVTASPETITADGTSISTITVQLVDANGNPLTSSGGTVALSTTVGLLSNVADNGDGTYTAALTSTTTGTATITATLDGNGLTDDATVTFEPGAASLTNSTVTADPTTITADGTSISTITVQLVDANGNPLTTSGGAVTVATTAGTLSNVVDNGDGTYTATLTAPTGAGTATVTATLDGSPLADDATVTFEPGAASLANSTVTASPETIAADGTSTSTITVQLVDANGNPLTTSGGAVTVATTAGTISNVVDNGDGTYTATLTAPTGAGTATITATLDGNGLTDDATVTFAPGAASLTNSTITADPTTITADGTSISTITVQLVDDNGNPLTTSGGAVAIATTAGTLSGVTDNGDGTYTATLTSTTTGTATITATLDGNGLTDDATVTFEPGAASLTNSTVTASPETIAADGTSISTITVQLVDDNGNPLTTSGGAVTVATTAGTISNVVDNGDGTYTATLTAPTGAGAATVTATLDGSPLTDDATVTFEPGAASLANSTVTASPETIAADGTSTSTITVQLVDDNGNPLTTSGGAVTVATTAGTLSNVVDNGDGTYTATLTAPTGAGAATVTATLDGNGLTDDATVTFAPGAASLTNSTVTASPETIAADGTSTSTITVQLVDANGNPLTTSGGAVTIATTSGTISNVVDNGDGTYTATLTAPPGAGTATVTATLDGNPLTDDATVTFAPGAASLANSTVTASPETIAADGTSTSTITVQLVDGNGNPLTTSGGTVTIATTAGTISNVVDNGDGTYTATLTAPPGAGTATITAALDGAPLADDATVTFAPGAASLANSTVTASPETIAADGTSTSMITVQLVDANGNPLTSSGGTVTIATTAGTLSNVIDNGDGTYTATLTAPTGAGTATITAALDGAPIQDDATVVFTPSGASLANSTVTASPETITADGTSTSTITVRLFDDAGNPLTTSGGVVTIATTAGTLSGVTDNGDGTYTATLTAPTTAGTAVVTAQVDGAPIEDDAEVAFVAGPPARVLVLSGNGQTGAVGQMLGDRLVLQVLDGFDNPISGVAVTFAPGTFPAGAQPHTIRTDPGAPPQPTIALVTDENGQASVIVQLGDRPGDYEVTADVGALGEVTFVVEAVVAAPARIEWIAGAGQIEIVGSTLDSAFVARVTDGFGNPMADVPVTFTLGDVPNGARGTALSASAPVPTDADGEAAVVLTLGDVEGFYTVFASVDGLGAVEIAALAINNPPNPSFIDTVNTVVFDGDPTRFMFVENTDELNMPNQLTLEMWLRPLELFGIGALIQKWGTDAAKQGGPDDQYRLWIDGETVHFEVQQQDGTVVGVSADEMFEPLAPELVDPNDPANYEWTHLAAVADADAGRVRLYRNGFEVAGADYDGTLNADGTRDVVMGAGYVGEIHEVRIWNVARTRLQLQANKNLRLSGSEDNLVVYLTFDEEEGRVAVDGAGGNNPAFLTDGVGRRLTIRNNTASVLREDEEFIMTFSALDVEEQGNLHVEIRSLPLHGTLYQYAGGEEAETARGDVIGAVPTAVTDRFRRILYVPYADYNGADSLRFYIQDSAGNRGEFTMTADVRPVNDAPRLPDLPPFVVDQRDTLHVSLDAYGIDVDDAPETLTWSFEVLDPTRDDGLKVSLDADRRVLMITSDDGYSASGVPLVLTAEDPDGLRDRDTTSVTVRFVNRAPAAFALTAPADASVLDARDPVTFTWEASSDLDAQRLSYILYLQGAGAELVVPDLPGTTYELPAGHPILKPGTDYAWHVEATDGMDTTRVVRAFAFETEPLPVDFELDQNYPNPFAGGTTITYEVPAEARVKLVVFDAIGREIGVLVDNPNHPPGVYTVRLEDGTFARLGSGIYVLRMEARTVTDGRRFEDTKQMVRVR